MTDFRDFLYIGQSEEVVDEKLESVKLSLALRFLRSSNMKKRLTGINEIKSIVESTGNRGIKTSSWHDDDSPRTTSRWLKPEYLCKWIHDNKLIEYLLGDTSHVEVIKRSSSVLIFLSKYEQLTKHHLDLLWKSLEDKHEATVLGVFETINEIAGSLDTMSIDYLFTKIKSLPIKKYNEQTVKFLKEFTIKGFGVAKNDTPGDLVDLSSGDEDEESKLNEQFVECARGILEGNIDPPKADTPEYGLPILFEICLQNTELGTHTLQSFIELLKLRHSDSFRAAYILKCIENLMNGVAVHQSLSIFTSIFNKAFNFRSFDAVLSPETAMIKLNDQFDFITLIIKNIERYNTVVQKAMVDQVKKGDVPENISKTKFEGNVAHSDQLEKLLEFVKFVVTTANNEIKVGTDNIQKLWNIFVSASSIEFDKNLFFKWLCKERNFKSHSVISSGRSIMGEGKILFSQEERHFLFTQILCQNEYVNKTEISYN